MTTKLNHLNINPEFESLFSFKTEEEKIEHQAQMISYRILSEIEKVCDEKKIKKKDLADMIGTSRSYITQLFNGTKSINTYAMAKFENVLDVTFEIRLKLDEESYGDFIGKQISRDLFVNKRISIPDGSLYFCHHDRGTQEIVEKLETKNSQKQRAA